MNNAPSILIVDRDRVVAGALEQQLTSQGYRVQRTTTGQAALTLLQREQANPQGTSIGVVLADQDDAGQAGGLGLIHQLHRDWPGVVPIMVSGFRKVEAAVQAMRLGAADYLLKPIVETELLDAVQRAVQRHLLLVEHATKQQELTIEAEADDDEANPSADSEASWTPTPLAEAMKAPERRILLTALQANGWNRGETAKALDINRTTLYKKIRQHRLDEPA